MIRNERQYRITKAQLEKFDDLVQSISATPKPGIHPRILQAQREAVQSQAEELREELAAYATTMLCNVKCLSCKQVGKVTINPEYIGYSATCDCYDGAPVHSGDSGPSAPHGMTKAEALAAWIERNECEGCKDGCDSCYPWRCEECGADDPKRQDDTDLHLCDECGPARRKAAAHANQRRCRDPWCDAHGDPPDDDAL